MEVAGGACGAPPPTALATGAVAGPHAPATDTTAPASNTPAAAIDTPAPAVATPPDVVHGKTPVGDTDACAARAAATAIGSNAAASILIAREVISNAGALTANPPAFVSAAREFAVLTRAIVLHAGVLSSARRAGAPFALPVLPILRAVVPPSRAFHITARAFHISAAAVPAPAAEVSDIESDFFTKSEPFWFRARRCPGLCCLRATPAAPSPALPTFQACGASVGV